MAPGPDTPTGRVHPRRVEEIARGRHQFHAAGLRAIPIQRGWLSGASQRQDGGPAPLIRPRCGGSGLASTAPWESRFEGAQRLSGVRTEKRTQTRLWGDGKPRRSLAMSFN